MNNKQQTNNFFHRLPQDMKQAIDSDQKVSEVWQSLTPLARSEWICWVTTVAKEETRAKHLARFTHDLLKGKRRPCCWPGCPHRNAKAQKFFNKNK